mmetsp:Transcript_46333/g.100522  ORF Transcript_46333/g.100522 Transcript_46333/m.100522 type:complete len:221 (-) Transcript_46333:46-708(-)
MMMIELSGRIAFLLPMTLAVVVAKIVADKLVKPLYPQHLALENIIVLSDYLKPTIRPLTAKEVMRDPPILRCPDEVATIHAALADALELFRVVESPDGRFLGTINRDALLAALRTVATTELPRNKQPVKLVHDVALSGTIETSDIANPDWVPQVDLDARWMENGVSADFRQFIDTDTPTVRPTARLRHVNTLFRKLGCSTVVVIDDYNIVQGVITRQSLG